MRYASIALLLVTSTAGAASWQQIGKIDANDGVLLVDITNVTEVKGYRKAWLKSVHTSDQPIPNEYHAAVGDTRSYRTMQSLSVFNCSKRTSAVIDFYWYRADEDRVGHFRNELLTFRPVAPGTLDEQVLETVCKADLAEPPAPFQEQAKMKRPVNPDDYYPRDSMRRGEQGAPVVRVCVDPKGKLLREPEIVESSGFPELDGAGIEVAKATRYAAGMKDGAVLPESCMKFKIQFRLRKNRMSQEAYPPSRDQHG